MNSTINELAMLPFSLKVFCTSLEEVFEIGMVFLSKFFISISGLNKNLIFRSNAFTEKWNLSDINNPSFIGVMPPAPKSRDYQFGIALFEVNNNTPYCSKSKYLV